MTDDELTVFWAWLYQQWCKLTCWDRLNDPATPTIVIRSLTSFLWVALFAITTIGTLITNTGVDSPQLAPHWLTAFEVTLAFYPTMITAFLVGFVLPNRTILALRGKKKTDPSRKTLAARIEANEEKALAPLHLTIPSRSSYLFHDDD